MANTSIPASINCGPWNPICRRNETLAEDNTDVVKQLSVYLAIVLCSVALLVNVITLAAFRKIRTKLSPRLLLAVNLLLSDVFVAIWVLLKHTLPYYLEIENCDTLPVFGPQSFLTTNFFLIFIAVDHFIAITKPLRYVSLVTRGKILVGACVVWIMSLLLFSIDTLAVFVHHKHHNVSNESLCHKVDDIGSLFAYIGVSIATVVIIISMYIKIISVTRVGLRLPTHVHNVALMLSSGTDNALPKRKVCGKRYTTLAGLLYITFLLCNAPDAIISVFLLSLNKHHDQNMPEYFRYLYIYGKLARVLGAISHPIIYGSKLELVKRQLLKFFDPEPEEDEYELSDGRMMSGVRPSLI